MVQNSKGTLRELSNNYPKEYEDTSQDLILPKTIPSMRALMEHYRKNSLTWETSLQMLRYSTEI